QSFFLPQPHATISPISMVTTATIGDSAAGNVSRTTIHAYRGTLAEAVIVAGLDPAFQRFALAHRQLALEAGLPFEFVSGRRSRSCSPSAWLRRGLTGAATARRVTTWRAIPVRSPCGDTTRENSPLPQPFRNSNALAAPDPSQLRNSKQHNVIQ